MRKAWHSSSLSKASSDTTYETGSSGRKLKEIKRDTGEHERAAEERRAMTTSRILRQACSYFNVTLTIYYPLAQIKP